MRTPFKVTDSWYCTDCECVTSHLSEDGRCPCGSGRVIAAPTLSADLSQMEPLGAEFTRVWDENVDKLYED